MLRLTSSAAILAATFLASCTQMAPQIEERREVHVEVHRLDDARHSGPRNLSVKAATPKTSALTRPASRSSTTTWRMSSPPAASPA